MWSCRIIGEGEDEATQISCRRRNCIAAAVPGRTVPGPTGSTRRPYWTLNFAPRYSGFAMLIGRPHILVARQIVACYCFLNLLPLGVGTGRGLRSLESGCAYNLAKAANFCPERAFAHTARRKNCCWSV